MLQFFLLILCIGCNLSAFEFSWEKVQAKLAQPLPEWMRQQIEEDLMPFYEKGVTSEMIASTIKNVRAIPSGHRADFVLYKIRDNKITVETFTNPLTDVRIAHVVEVLEDMAKYLRLPDVEFLSSIWDSYDNPLYLEQTECPVFTMCKLKSNHCGVLFPEFRHFSYRKRSYNDICCTNLSSPWKSKAGIAFWRGMTSGWHYNYEGWDLKPRSRLVLFSKEYPELVDAAFTDPYSLSQDIKRLMETYDLFKQWTYLTAFVKYKYLVSIDGNTFASNFWWGLLANCAVLKSNSDYVEWFYKGVVPYVHYVPFEPDLSDFKEKVLWLKNHDREAEKIAAQGENFAREHLSNEALMVYFYRLLQAYAALYRAFS